MQIVPGCLLELYFKSEEAPLHWWLIEKDNNASATAPQHQHQLVFNLAKAVTARQINELVAGYVITKRYNQYQLTLKRVKGKLK